MSRFDYNIRISSVKSLSLLWTQEIWWTLTLNIDKLPSSCWCNTTFASTFAVLDETIPPFVTTSALFGGEVPLGKFVPIGGDNISREILDTIGDKFAIIMQNHGVFTIGYDARHAAKVAVELEEVAKSLISHWLEGTRSVYLKSSWERPRECTLINTDNHQLIMPNMTDPVGQYKMRLINLMHSWNVAWFCRYYLSSVLSTKTSIKSFRFENASSYVLSK